MKSREELLRESACNPQGIAEYAFQLQEQLRSSHQALSEKDQLLTQAQAIIADLKRELFGAKADKLNAEQEEQLRQLAGDVQEQNQHPPPLSQEVLEEALAQESLEQRRRAKERSRRHLPALATGNQKPAQRPGAGGESHAGGGKGRMEAAPEGSVNKGPLGKSFPDGPS